MPREEQKMRSEHIRQAILDTALEIGIKEGFEEVSIRKIIKQMNYSTGVVYHHFKDKQEIINAIETAQTQWLHSQIKELLDPNKDIAAEMKTVFYRITRLAYEEPEKAAFSIWSSFLGFNLMISTHTDLTWEQAEEMFQVQLNMILKGVLSHE